MTALALDHQIDAYVAAGLPTPAGLPEPEFRALFEPLRESASALPQEHAADTGLVPYLAVVSDALVDPASRVTGMRLPGSTREGILDRNHGDEGLAPYRPTPELEVPAAPVYLLVGIDRGDEFRDVAPRDALPVIAERSRTPLTIAEGLSLMAVYPELLVKNHCFMLAGSSRGDKRVPAIWISQKAPKLGWCFQGVPHTWLGVASASSRVG
ncbi:DUF5701 family protein [Demequina sp. NBRC 110056]|uniref:DUF5701 family protein n=1 Tax=Demequina sp. NBRC 110056 TaxID=1570345 RepID=UPI000A051357|nr:DUF5701 family protein [Demequina sp. NBRC 110056]